jgi:hypothetical protein
MVLAESVQIDGRVVLLFLAALGLILLAYGALLILGARAVYRGSLPAATDAARTRLAVVVALDAVLFSISLRGGLRLSSPFALPAIVHGVAWLMARSSGTTPPS